MSNVQKMFTAQADTTHQTGNILKSGGNNLAVSVLMSGQVFHNSGIYIWNIVREGAVQYNQIRIESKIGRASCRERVFRAV